MFDYFISLGFFCGVAASMDHYGLRSYSGPFDWCFSDFEGVIQTIEEKFKHFLDYENLAIVPDRPKEFKDIRYQLHFMHDIENSGLFSQEYPAIKEKYIKRSKCFLKMLEHPCCCIRAVQNKEEIAYIESHEKQIQALLKTYHPENDILYLIPEEFKTIPVSFSSFYYIANYDGRFKEALPRTFDSNPELVHYLLSHANPKTRSINLARKQKTNL